MKFEFLKARSRQNLVGVEVDEDHIKIAFIRQSSLRREVAAVVSRQIRGLSDDDVVVFVRQTLQDLKLKDARIYLTAPLYQLITRSIEIPSVDPVEIREIVNLQANRHTPYARSEIIVDMLIIGLVRENYTKVLLVIAPKELVNRQTQIVERAGLKLEKIFFPPEGIALACSRIIEEGSFESVTAVAHIDFSFTTFFMIQQGKILFVRGIPIGASHLVEEREIYHDRFADELQKSLEAYTSDEMGPPPKSVIATGSFGDIQALDEILTETLNVPVKRQLYYNYFSASDAAKSTMVSARQVSYFNVVSSVLLFDKMKVDLTSEEKKLQKKLEERGKEMFKTGILTLLLLSLVFAGFLTKVATKKTYLQQLTARYHPVREEAKNLEAMFSKTQGIKDFLTSRGVALETLSELYQATPLEIRLTGIKYDENGKYTIKGTSTLKASIFTFVANLEKSDVFKTVKTKYVTSRNDNGMDVADFEINCLVDRKGFAP